MSYVSKVRALKLLLTGDESKRWVLAEKTALLFSSKAILGEFNKIWKSDSDFIRTVKKLPCNQRQWERLYVIDQITKYCAKLSGDFVECGTHSGSSAYFLCANSRTQVFLFDSWEGLSRPLPIDGNYWTEGDLDSKMEEAQNTLSDFNNAHFLKGWIPERFSEVSDRKFSFVHIDVDIYEPTLASVTFFWERLSSGGVLICDDYGFNNCVGAKMAIDKFFEGIADVISLPTGQGMVIKN